MAPPEPNPNPMTRVLAALNNYKEVLAIVAFFLSGVWWIQDRYPTKTDLKSQLAIITCQLDEYMKLTQVQVRHEQLITQLNQLDQQIRSATPNTHLSPSLQQIFSDLQGERTSVREKSDSASAEMQKINDDLARNMCARAG